MGEEQGTLFALDFNRSVRIEARPERLTGDTGVLLVREVSDRLNLPALVKQHLNDPRALEWVTHPFVEIFRTRVFAMAQGWLDQNDVGLLHDDPAFRLAVSERRGDTPLRESTGQVPDGLCSQPTLSRFMGVLGSRANRSGLGHIVRLVVQQFIKPRSEVTLDLDSIPYEVHGHQPGSAYNGHYGIRCYHPLVASVGGRWFLGARLRAGTAHTAAGGLDFVLPIIRWLRSFVKRVWLRVDAGFPAAEFLETLEAEGIPYVCRLRSNPALDRLAEPFLHRPPGRPPAEGRTWFHELSYGAESWNKDRRVVLVVVERPDEQQHLFLDSFFLLTSVTLKTESAEALLARYRQRGSAEADFGDCNTALSPALSSAPRPKSHYAGQLLPQPLHSHDAFAANEAELLLTLLAANLMAAGAQLLHTEGQPRLSRERFRTLLLKTTGRVILGGHAVTVVIPSPRAGLWNRFWKQLAALLPRGSPGLEALPAHA